MLTQDNFFMTPLADITLFRDWYIFYQSGKAVQNGISPYLVEGYLNPIQVAWVLSLTTYIPFSFWVIVMCSVAFVLIVILVKKRSHWVLLSFPFIFGLAMGSLDVFLWIPARLFGGWALPLLTLKPQIGVFVIPMQLMEWWRERNIKQLKLFLIGLILLWGIPIIIQPTWLLDWIHALPSISMRMNLSASFAGFSAMTGGEIIYGILFLAVLIILLAKGNNDYYMAAAFAPSFWPSDWIIASEFIGWRFSLLSWALIPTGLTPNGAQFYFLLGFLVWAEKHPDTARNWVLSVQNYLRSIV